MSLDVGSVHSGASGKPKGDMGKSLSFSPFFSRYVTFLRIQTESGGGAIGGEAKGGMG